MPWRGSDSSTLNKIARTLRRRLFRSPLASIGAIAILALAIAANTAIFSLLDGVVLRPLPYPDAQTLLEVGTIVPGQSLLQEVSWPKFLALQSAGGALRAVAADVRMSFAVRPGAETEIVDGARVSAGFFDVWGMRTLVGRTFSRQEQSPVGTPVAMLAEPYWRRQFASDPHVLGRVIDVDGRATTVIGVLAGAPQLPFEGVRIWLPRPEEVGFLPRPIIDKGAGYLHVVGRLAPDATLEMARTGVAALSQRYAAAWPSHFDAAYGLGAAPLLESLLGSVRSILWVLLAAVGLLLLVACADVANLRLAEGLARRREVAVRRALGATAGSVAFDALADGLLIALASGLAGTLLAIGALRALAASQAADLPRLAEIHVSLPALLFTFAVTLIASLLASAAPAWQAMRSDPRRFLVEGGRGSSDSVGTSRAQGWLVSGQLALALVLFAASGLLIRSLHQVQRVDLGFRPDDLLLAEVTLPEARFPSIESRRDFFDRLIAAARTLPGVEGAAVVDYTPTAGAPHTRIATAGGVRFSPEQMPVVMRGLAGDGYLSTLGARFIAGADFDPARPVTAPPTAILSRSLAELLFSGRDPIGSEIELRGVATPLEIVGVIDDLQQAPLEQAKEPMLFVSLRQAGAELAPPNFAQLALRARGPADSTAAALRRLVGELDPAQVVPRLETMRSILQRASARRRLTTALFGGFTLLSFGLALVGLLAVAVHAVASHRRELGVRVALGATPARLAAGVLVLVWRWIAPGLILGTVGAWMAGRALASQLYEVSGGDPLQILIAAALVAGVASVACLAPAMAAARVDPRQVLRPD